MSELEDFVAEESTAEEVAEQATPEVVEEAAQEPVSEVTEEPEVEAQAPETPPEGSTAEPETPEKTTKEVPLTALLDERDKRKRYQAQVEEMQRQLDEAKKEPLPDVLEDQEGFVGQLRQEFQQTILQNRIEDSQEMMRMLHEDYDDVEARFVEMAGDTPELAAQMRDARNPAKFAYDTVKKAEKLAQLDNVEEMEAKLRAEAEKKAREDLEKQYQEKIAELEEKVGSLSPSIAGQRAAGANTPVITFEDPLETTFNR